MRVIKFRRYSHMINKWTYGSDPLIDEPLIDATSIGQFTGLKDVNGAEIYEGDIVKSTNIQGNEVIGQVYFNYGSFVVHNYYFKNLNNLEVQGNIYENKEIIKE